MQAKFKRRILWSLVVLLTVAGLVYSFRPQPVAVDVHIIESGPLQVTVSEEGETRVKEIYMLSSPITGRMLRIHAEVGDEVTAAKTVIAQIEPQDPNFLDRRTEKEVLAEIKAAEAAVALAYAEKKEAESELAFARSELQRARRLILNNTISERELDAAEKEYNVKLATIETRKAAIRARQSELAQAKARLITPIDTRSGEGVCECLSLYAPASGKVLRLLHESEAVITAGETLVEIGDPNDLEIVVDFLSIDAVKIRPQQRVLIDQWGGDSVLYGVVSKVEPLGFTKVSSLGIEEQRVNVIIDFDPALPSSTLLGHGFQVEAHVILWEAENVTKIPLTALFRDGSRWATYVIDAGQAQLRHLEIGQRNQLEVEVSGGLHPGDAVILHPNNHITNGIKVIDRKPITR